MKKTLFLLLFAAMLLQTVWAAETNGPSLNASVLYYEPVPATPGSLVDVYVQVENAGTETSRVEVRFVDNGPFTLDNEADRVKTTPSIPGQETFLIKYKVRVDTDAVPGTNHLKIEYRIGGSMNTYTALLPLDIASRTVSLSIADIKLDPEVLVPGGIGTVTVIVHNDADQKVTSGSMKLDLGSVDIIPVGASNQQRFTEIQAGEDAALSFELAPSPSITPGVYKVPVNLTFKDQQGNSYTMSETIGLRVGATPDVSIVVDENNLEGEDKEGEVFIRVTNKGLGEIKFVNIELAADPSYEFSGSSERYVGNIDSDDYKTARVALTAKDSAVSIPVKVTFMDALNTRYTEETTLKFNVKKPEGGGGSKALIAIIVLALIIGGYFVLRKRK